MSTSRRMSVFGVSWSGGWGECFESAVRSSDSSSAGGCVATDLFAFSEAIGKDIGDP